MHFMWRFHTRLLWWYLCARCTLTRKQEFLCNKSDVVKKSPLLDYVNNHTICARGAYTATDEERSRTSCPKSKGWLFNESACCWMTKIMQGRKTVEVTTLLEVRNAPTPSWNSSRSSLSAPRVRILCLHDRESRWGHVYYPTGVALFSSNAVREEKGHKVLKKGVARARCCGHVVFRLLPGHEPFKVSWMLIVWGEAASALSTCPDLHGLAFFNDVYRCQQRDQAERHRRPVKAPLKVDGAYDIVFRRSV